MLFPAHSRSSPRVKLRLAARNVFRKKGAFVIWANPFCAYGLGNYVQRRGLAAAVAAAKYGYRLKFKLFQPLFRKDGKGGKPFGSMFALVRGKNPPRQPCSKRKSF